MTSRFSSMFLSVMLVLASPLPVRADAIADLDDATARIQYGFYTADVRAIENAIALIQRLDLPVSRQGMKEYYTAYGYWMVAEIHAHDVDQRGSRTAAVKAAKACEQSAEAAIDLKARVAESHAMAAICGELASRTPNVLARGCANDKDLRIARELEPNNLRVRLIEAQCLAEDDKQAEDLLRRMEKLVKEFDDAPARNPGIPDWGHAEALLLLGTLQIKHGNSVGARDTIERALVIAPDFERARQALQQAARGSR